jgi:hypothetical protein
VFPHRRAITVVLVLLGQNENQPPQGSEKSSGERDRNPSALEQKRRAGETGDRPSNNEAKERRRVHDVPDKRNVMLNGPTGVPGCVGRRAPTPLEVVLDGRGEGALCHYLPSSYDIDITR